MHRIAGAVAEVVDERFGLGGLVEQAAEAEHMGFGQIAHMDVIADAGAIGGGVVVAEDLQVGAAARHHIKHERDQVGFRVVVFTQIAIGIGAGSIEIAENHTGQPVGSAKIAEQLLHHGLTAAVGIDRRLGVLFGDRNLLGHPIGGAGAGKHNRHGPVGLVGAGAASLIAARAMVARVNQGLQ